MTAQLKRGFTLIELLIVMAILGVLAVVVLVAINPVQQLARTRDAGRKSAISQIGRALEAYYTSHNGTYMAASTTYLNVLSTSGEIGTVPSAISYRGGFTPVACVTGQNYMCYTTNAGAEAVLFTELESDSERSKCAGGVANFVWSTFDGRGGLVCGAPNAAGTSQSWSTVQ